MQVFNLVVFLLVSWTIQQKHFVGIDSDKITITKKENILIAKLPFEIESGLHIQDFSDTKGNVLPSNIYLDASDQYELVSYELTETQYETVVLDGVKHQVLSKNLEITIKIKLKRADNGKVQGQLFYQACNDRQCFFPRTLSFSVPY